MIKELRRKMSLRKKALSSCQVDKWIGIGITKVENQFFGIAEVERKFLTMVQLSIYNSISRNATDHFSVTLWSISFSAVMEVSDNWHLKSCACFFLKMVHYFFFLLRSNLTNFLVMSNFIPYRIMSRQIPNQ